MSPTSVSTTKMCVPHVVRVLNVIRATTGRLRASAARALITLAALSSLVLASACAPLDGGSTTARTSTTPIASGTNSTSASGSTTENGYADEYRIGVGDSLAINVWRNDDLSVTVPVRPDGKISVPLAGDIEVGERTPEEVSAAITQKLAKYIRDPFVTVIVTDMGSAVFRNRVRVTGAVQKPVSIPYRQGMTVLDVVLEAGGVNEFASLSRASLFRRDGTRLPVRLDHILRRGQMATNYTIRAGDVVTVPQSAF